MNLNDPGQELGLMTAHRDSASRLSTGNIFPDERHDAGCGLVSKGSAIDEMIFLCLPWALLLVVPAFQYIQNLIDVHFAYR